jgi:hypothetical protein
MNQSHCEHPALGPEDQQRVRTLNKARELHALHANGAQTGGGSWRCRHVRPSRDGHQHCPAPAVRDGAGGANELKDGVQHVAMRVRVLAAVATGGSGGGLAPPAGSGSRGWNRHVGSPSTPAAWLSIWWIAAAMSWTEGQAEVASSCRSGGAAGASRSARGSSWSSSGQQREFWRQAGQAGHQVDHVRGLAEVFEQMARGVRSAGSGALQPVGRPGRQGPGPGQGQSWR